MSQEIKPPRKFLQHVYYNYDNLAKTAKLALYSVAVVAAVVGTVLLIQVASAS